MASELNIPYYSISAETSLERICANREPKFYEAGMDLKLSNNPYKSYVIFQNRVNAEYQKMLSEYNIVEIDATKSIHAKQADTRAIVKKVLAGKGVKL